MRRRRVIDKMVRLKERGIDLAADVSVVFEANIGGSRRREDSPDETAGRTRPQGGDRRKRRRSIDPNEGTERPKGGR